MRLKSRMYCRVSSRIRGSSSFVLSPVMLFLLVGILSINLTQAKAHSIPPVSRVLGQVKSVTHGSIQIQSKPGVVSLDIPKYRPIRSSNRMFAFPLLSCRQKGETHD